VKVKVVKHIRSASGNERIEKARRSQDRSAPRFLSLPANDPLAIDCGTNTARL